MMIDEKATIASGGSVFVGLGILGTIFADIDFSQVNLEMILEILKSNAIKALAGSGFIFTGLASFFFARYYFRARKFLGRCNISMNYFISQENREKPWALRFATLREDQISKMLDNKYAERTIVHYANALNPKPWWKFWLRHAPIAGRKQNFIEKLGSWRRIARQKTTIITFDHDAYTTVMKQFLNAVSEIFPDGHLAQAIGVKRTSATFVFWLTCEWDTMVWANKTRLFLLEKNLFIRLMNEPAEFDDDKVDIKNPNHIVRLHSLREAAQTYHLNPATFFEIELSLPQ